MADEIRRIESALGEIGIVPFGIDTSVFTPAARPSHGFTVGTVKSLAHRYGIDILLRGFALACVEAGRRGLDPGRWTLVVAGEGPQAARLRALAAELGIGERVVFTGFVRHSMVPALLAQMDVFVAVSRSESFGVAVLEASASGVPVVVSRVGGLPEVVVDRETGIIVDPESPDALARALVELAADPHRRSELGRRGRDHVLARYSWGQSISLLENEYARLKGACPSPAVDARLF